MNKELSNLEARFAKKITSKLDQADLPSDISARLAFARNKALEAAKVSQIHHQVNSDGTLSGLGSAVFRKKWGLLLGLLLSLMAYTSLISSDDLLGGDTSFWQARQQLESEYVQSIDPDVPAE